MPTILDSNPYEQFYKPGFGSIFGKPMSFNKRCDPGQRIFQDTMLKNNSIIRITPGLYDFDKNKVDRADKILEEHRKEEAKLMANPGKGIETELARLNAKTQSILVSQGIDMRYLTFKPDFTGFLRSYQLLLNKASTSLFSKSAIGANTFSFINSIGKEAMIARGSSQSAKYRGFNLWVEKSTSVSESVSNSFTSSVFEGLVGKVSRWSREIQALTGESTGANITGSTKVDVETGNGMYHDQMSRIGKMFNSAGSALTGAKVILPQIWDDSKFDRSYNVSFRFVSPYGDDRSVYLNVIVPFLFILTLALPRQDGPSGMQYPYLAQMDCPGYFSCPMGIINSLSFVKGGSDVLFNSSGLPLIIEGTFSIGDLYSSLSLPQENKQFVTNLGTAAFITNLVGGNMYSALDTSITEKITNYAKSGLLKVTDPLNLIQEKKLDLLRYTGLVNSVK